MPLIWKLLEMDEGNSKTQQAWMAWPVCIIRLSLTFDDQFDPTLIYYIMAIRPLRHPTAHHFHFADRLCVSEPQANRLHSDFPSLSNNSQMPNSGQSSMWSTGASRNMAGTIQRNQPTPHSQPGHDDIFSSASRMGSNQGSFRFGSQPAQSSQPQPSSIDDFPPLNMNNFRNGNGEIGQERGMSLMTSLGFGAQGAAATNSLQGSTLQGTRAGNGLLNALSANNRTGEVRSPDTASAPGT